MYQKFKELIKVYSPISDEELDYIMKNVPLKQHKRGDMLLNQGEIPNHIFYVLGGSVRLFYIANGMERTAFFYSPGKFVAAGESFTFEKPAIENFQCIEDSSILYFKREVINDMLASNPTFDVITRNAMEEELISMQKMIASFITKSPEERYIELMETNKELFQRVHQQYIASYLGVSPETLSRIKKRVILKEKNKT